MEAANVVAIEARVFIPPATGPPLWPAGEREGSETETKAAGSYHPHNNSGPKERERCSQQDKQRTPSMTYNRRHGDNHPAEMRQKRQTLIGEVRHPRQQKSDCGKNEGR